MTSTGPVESWSQSPETLGAIYPFLGFEWLMVAISVVAWVGWTVWQIRNENAEYEPPPRSFAAPCYARSSILLPIGGVRSLSVGARPSGFSNARARQ